MWSGLLTRDDGAVVGKIGHAGHTGGQVHWLHVANMDSDGNLYTGEVDSGKWGICSGQMRRARLF
jgi:hypothetical protein